MQPLQTLCAMDFDFLHEGMDRALDTGKDKETAFGIYFGVDCQTMMPAWAFANTLFVYTSHDAPLVRYHAAQDHIVPTARIMNPFSTYVKRYNVSYGALLEHEADFTSVESLMVFYRQPIQDFVEKNTGIFIYKENEATMALLNDKQSKAFPYAHHYLP